MGKQMKRCEDNIQDRTGINFASSTRAENRTRWIGVVIKVTCGAPTCLQGYGID